MDLECLPLESVEIISHLVPNETEVSDIFQELGKLLIKQTGWQTYFTLLLCTCVLIMFSSRVSICKHNNQKI